MANTDYSTTYDFDSALKDLAKSGLSIAEINTTEYSDDEANIEVNENNKLISNPDYDIGLAIDPDTLTDDQKERLIKEYNTVNNKNKINRINRVESDNQIETTWEDFENEDLKFSDSGVYRGAIGTIGSVAGLASQIFGTMYNDAAGLIDNLYKSGANIADDIISALGSNGDTSGFGSFLKGSFQILANNLKDYQDGVSETSFGSMMEQSWVGSSTKSFLNYFSKNMGSQKVSILSSTPMDPGPQRDALFGTLMLGTPYLFNEGADPLNRTLVNTIIKDARFLTLTPGMPKYNGTSYSQSKKDNILYQTETPDSMLNYLLSNGIDKNFSDKDKRYYTFKTNYEEYYKYLETMLNAIWVKLGLASSGHEFNLLTFFDIKKNYDEASISNSGQLLSRYNSSIGFFVNGSGGITEAVSNDRTNFGGELESTANSASDDYQRLNYITGMGTGSTGKNVARKTAIMMTAGSQLKSTIGSNFGNTISAAKEVAGASGLKIFSKLAQLGITAALDVSKFNATQDIGSLMQQFSTTNGMKLKYPELWSDSSYSKAMNFNFTFVSPYGDPYSIFKYVYVPFCALLCFALPRQAAENGYVSPFFVRADIPGLFTSDLALISDMSWTRGGGAGLFTKDGLPRAMDVSITIDDLYPYLSMGKRVSYLSANPSYAMFLNSFTGTLALNDNESEDGLNRYFEELLNRVNGLETKTHVWNKFNSYKRDSIKESMSSYKNSISDKLDITSMPWLHNSSI